MLAKTGNIGFGESTLVHSGHRLLSLSTRSQVYRSHAFTSFLLSCSIPFYLLRGRMLTPPPKTPIEYKTRRFDRKRTYLRTNVETQDPGYPE